MRFQPVICNMMLLTRKHLNKIQASYTLEGAVLENVDNIKYLGVTIQACHNFFVKKPKIFENVKSERAAANFQKSRTPRVSTIISKKSQI